MADKKKPSGYVPPHLRVGSSLKPSMTPSLASSDKSNRFIPPHLRGLNSSSSSVSKKPHPLASVAINSVQSDDKTQMAQGQESADLLISFESEPPETSKLTYSNLLAAHLCDPMPPEPERRQKAADSVVSVKAVSTRKSESSTSTTHVRGQTMNKWPQPDSRGYYEQPTPSTASIGDVPRKGMISSLAGKSFKPHRCSFEGCLASFETFKGLKAHKKERHYYCGLCDIDFKNDNDHLLHKIESSKHIVCPVCSEDFRTLAGRDRHFKLVS